MRQSWQRLCSFMIMCSMNSRHVVLGSLRRMGESRQHTTTESVSQHTFSQNSQHPYQIRHNEPKSETATAPATIIDASKCEVNEFTQCGDEGVWMCQYDSLHSNYQNVCVSTSYRESSSETSTSTTCGPCQRCFEDTQELRQAVHEYNRNSSSTSDVAQIYGWPIGKWCVSKIVDFSFLFFNQRNFNEDISAWDVSKAVNMSHMFQAAFSFNQPLNDWDVSHVQDLDRMFDSAYAFDQPLDDWNVTSVTSMNRIFRVAKQFQQSLQSWDVSRVTDLSMAFYRATSWNQDLSSWNVGLVKDMSYMFASARQFNQPLYDWDVSSVTDMRGMFQDASTFNQDLRNWDVSQVTDMAYLFYGAAEFRQDLSSWDLTSLEDASALESPVSY